jgi:hypothetical protein
MIEKTIPLPTLALSWASGLRSVWDCWWTG